MRGRGTPPPARDAAHWVPTTRFRQESPRPYKGKGGGKEPGPPIHEGQGVGVPAKPVQVPSSSRIPKVAQEYVDEWSENTWFKDKTILNIHAPDLKRTDHGSYVVAQGNNWGFGAGKGDSAHDKEVTLFARLLTNYGSKYH